MSSSKHSMKPPIETQARPVDVEAWEGDDASKPPAPVPTRLELTPNQAFKWNVDGDQSPCKSASLSLIVVRQVDHR